MSSKAWFLCPGAFDLFPDSDIGLGRVLKYPNRPTLELAALPPAEPKTWTEKSHAHSTTSGSSASASLFAKFTDLASASGQHDTSRHQNLTFGPVDHDVRVLAEKPSEETVRALVQSAAVKKFMHGGPGGRFKQRPIYIIGGLRVAKESFSVTLGSGSNSSTSAEASFSPAAAGAPVPGEAGAGLARGRDHEETHEFTAASGVVLFYRLYIVRPKEQAELFGDKEAFYTGEGGSDDDDIDLDISEANAKAVEITDDVQIDPILVGDGTLNGIKDD